ncbi:MAG: carbon-nitrogen hydrolase [Bacteroidales bacterium]
MKNIAVGIVQQANTVDRSENIARLQKHIASCAKQGAQLVVLQELHNSVYFCQTENVECFAEAESVPGPSTALYGALAAQYSIVLVTSLFEKRAAGIYHNTSVVFDTDGSVAGMYRKMHIPDDPGFYEKFYFTPGDLGFEPVETSLGKIGVLICWDQWYPEAARLMALKGAEILVYPTAIGWDVHDTVEERKRQHDAWMLIQRSHAVANGVPVVSVNRCGFEEDVSKQTSGIHFWGSSFVAGQQGDILYECASDSEEIAVVSVDMNRTEEVRQIWPFLRDRRIDAYEDITQRYID